MCENPAVHGSHCVYVNSLNVRTIMLLFLSADNKEPFYRTGHQELSENCQPCLQVNTGFLSWLNELELPMVPIQCWHSKVSFSQTFASICAKSWIRVNFEANFPGCSQIWEWLWQCVVAVCVFKLQLTDQKMLLICGSGGKFQCHGTQIPWSLYSKVSEYHTCSLLWVPGGSQVPSVCGMYHYHLTEVRAWEKYPGRDVAPAKVAIYAVVQFWTLPPPPFLKSASWEWPNSRCLSFQQTQARLFILKVSDSMFADFSLHQGKIGSFAPQWEPSAQSLDHEEYLLFCWIGQTMNSASRISSVAPRK